MMSAKRLARLVKKWQRSAALGRKRLAWSSSTPEKETEGSCSTSYSSMAGKGHCVVYTADRVRFEVPLAFLSMKVFAELLWMSNEEFGFSGGNGRIMLSCDAAVMEYAVCLLGRNASAEMEARVPRVHGDAITMPL